MAHVYNFNERRRTQDLFDVVMVIPVDIGVWAKFKSEPSEGKQRYASIN